MVRPRCTFGLLFAAVVGCRGFVQDTGPYEACDADGVGEDRVRARRIPCDDESIAGGEARRADYLIENAWVRFGVRHPGAPLTLLEGGGGTVIDAAVPGELDSLAELVPLVGGCWLADTRLELEQAPDGAAIHLRGTPTPVSFLDGLLPCDAEPGEHSVSYALGPDDRALSIAGADAFWLMPVAGMERSGNTLRLDGRMLAIDGEVRDLGGGLLVTGGARLGVGEPSAVMAAVWPGGDSVQGSTDGDGVEIMAGSAVVGWLPVDEQGAFSGVVPDGADGLRAIASGHAPGPVAALEASELTLGGAGRVGVRVAPRDGRELPALVTAMGGHGGRSLHPVGPDGAWLELGRGAWTLAVDAGPLYTRGEVQLELREDSEELSLLVDGPGPPWGWVLADLWLEAWPSRVDRREPSLAVSQAAARGVGFAVVGAPDEVATAALERPFEAAIATGDGSWAVSEDQGTVLAWPVSANRRKPAHGAADHLGLPAEDILRVAAGSSNQRRNLAVSMSWLAAAGPSWSWDPWPDLLALDEHGDLAELIALCDGWVDLTPTGPLTWVDVGHGEPASAQEVERALLEGRTVAGTGPFIALQVAGHGPGSIVPGRGPHRVSFSVLAPRDVPMEGAALWVDGVELERWDLTGGLEDTRLDITRTIEAERYILATAWGDRDLPDPHWVITAPVWAGRP